MLKQINKKSKEFSEVKNMKVEMSYSTAVRRHSWKQLQKVEQKDKIEMREERQDK